MPTTQPVKTSGVQNTESRKRRREWLLIAVIIGLVALSLRYQGQLFELTSEIPLSGNILILALINMNILSKEAVLEAHEDPATHPDLMIRVTGYSAYFVQLSKGLQDSIIDRTQQSFS